jgi:hypothetical protein
MEHKIMEHTRSGRPSYRPSLEQLESRLTPAVVLHRTDAAFDLRLAETQAVVDNNQLLRDLGHALAGPSQAATVRAEVTRVERDLKVGNRDFTKATEEAPDPHMKADVQKALQAGFDAVRNFSAGRIKAALRAIQKLERAFKDYWDRIDKRIKNPLNIPDGQGSLSAPPAVPPSTATAFKYTGNFTGHVQNTAVDGADPDGSFIDSYGGPATLLVTANPGGGYTLQFSARLSASRPHGEDFSASPNGTLTVASLGGVSFRFPMGDGNCAVQGALGNGVFSGSWRFVQADPTDNSDSGSGTFTLSLSPIA